MAAIIEPPPIGPSGWALESAVERSARFPDTFLIPSETERGDVRIGQGVKLLFWTRSAEDGVPVCERMWVLVTARTGNGAYEGRLESTPETPGALARGAHVRFGPEHIAEIYDGPTH